MAVVYPRDDQNGASRERGPNRMDDDTSESDDDSVTSDLTELTSSEDFERHFDERDGRLFHSHGQDLPYPLPVDGPEQDRLNKLHEVAQRFLGANYVGPVRDVLVLEAGRPSKRVIDLCTGTGKWILDMAQEFGHVKFRGFDIVPIATQYPPQNVLFEVHDVNQPFRWLSGSVDLVHARGVGLAVSDYCALLQEAARVLRPGGLFLSCEWDRYITFHPDYSREDARRYAPGAFRFLDVVANTLYSTKRIARITDAVPNWLTATGSFTAVTPEKFYVPIGDWHNRPELQSLGVQFRDLNLEFTKSLLPVLRQAGWQEACLQELLHAYLADLYNVKGLVCVFHTVHAQRA